MSSEKSIWQALATVGRYGRLLWTKEVQSCDNIQREEGKRGAIRRSDCRKQASGRSILNEQNHG